MQERNSLLEKNYKTCEFVSSAISELYLTTAPLGKDKPQREAKVTKSVQHANKSAESAHWYS
jgi:hypothetical protein